MYYDHEGFHTYLLCFVTLSLRTFIQFMCHVDLLRKEVLHAQIEQCTHLERVSKALDD